VYECLSTDLSTCQCSKRSSIKDVHTDREWGYVKSGPIGKWGRGYLSYSGQAEPLKKYTNICQNLQLLDTAIPKND